MTDDMTIRLDSEVFVLRPDGGRLNVGRRVGEEVTWLDAVDLEVLPEAARTALERGETDEQTLRTAVRGVAQAEVQRGG
jgi:hypothetical protein